MQVGDVLTLPLLCPLKFSIIHCSFHLLSTVVSSEHAPLICPSAYHVHNKVMFRGQVWVHTSFFSPSMQETETGEPLNSRPTSYTQWVQTSQNYVVRPCMKERGAGRIYVFIISRDSWNRNNYKNQCEQASMVGQVPRTILVAVMVSVDHQLGSVRNPLGDTSPGTPVRTLYISLGDVEWPTEWHHSQSWTIGLHKGEESPCTISWLQTQSDVTTKDWPLKL